MAVAGKLADVHARLTALGNADVAVCYAPVKIAHDCPPAPPRNGGACLLAIIRRRLAGLRALLGDFGSSLRPRGAGYVGEHSDSGGSATMP